MTCLQAVQCVPFYLTTNTGRLSDCALNGKYLLSSADSELAAYFAETGRLFVAVKRICQGELLSDSVSKSSSGVVFADRPIE